MSNIFPLPPTPQPGARRPEAIEVDLANDRRRLRTALDAADWSAVHSLVDDNFFAYLFDIPDLLQEVFDAAPAHWYQDYPRVAMTRAIADAVRRPATLIADEPRAAFEAWVASQEAPATRDMLGLRQAHLRVLITSGRYRDASLAADEDVRLLRRADDSLGFHDVLPSVLIRCGTAKLLDGEIEASLALFSEAVHWSTVRGEHPIAPYARAHLALSYALLERYQQAARLLQEHLPVFAPGAIQYQYQWAGVLAGVIVAAGELRHRDAEDQLSELDRSLVAGDCWWIVLHAKAMVALNQAAPWPMIEELDEQLARNAARASPATGAGCILRADLAMLYQAAGDLRAAEHLLSTKGIPPAAHLVVLGRARQELLRGRPERTLALLHADEQQALNVSPVRRTPQGAVIYAAAELAITGQLAHATAQAAVAAVNGRHAYSALVQAPSALRDLLAPFVEIPLAEVPVTFDFRPVVKLTRREKDMLNALRVHGTVAEAAAALHISPNTAKTHISALYRKLGARSRDEAIWLGLR